MKEHKLYSLWGFINAPGSEQPGDCLGGVGLDGYNFPYNAGGTSKCFFSNVTPLESVLKNIKNFKLDIYNPDLGPDAGVFDSAYCEAMCSKPGDTRYIRYVLVKYDYTHPIEPVSIILDTVDVEYYIGVLSSYTVRSQPVITD